MSCAGYLAEYYRDRERRLREECERLQKHKETLEKLGKIDMLMEKLENIEEKRGVEQK
jgi:hypothetical protein